MADTRLKHASVLYVEDDAKVRCSMARVLSHYFGTVEEADDAETALRVFRSRRPDAVFVDIVLPGEKDGLDFAEEVRRVAPEVPIVVISAYSDTPKLLRAVELGLVKYLVKPIDKASLEEVLRKVADALGANKTTRVYLGKRLWWEEPAGMLYDDGEPVPLTGTERTVLSVLASRAGECVTYETLFAEVWPEDIERMSVDALKYHISALRKKLPEGTIRNIYAKGYRLIPSL